MNKQIPTQKITWILTGAVWIAAIGLYATMPERMATHWNAMGEADGHSGKLFGLFLVPLVMTAIQMLFAVLPKMDPLKSNSTIFKKQFEEFALLFAVFMAYLFGAILVWNKGVVFSMTTALVPAFAVLFYGIGILLHEVKRNWFMGIRTPWTMSSDVVWDKTHALGSKLFKACGLIILLGFLFPQYVIGLILIPIIISTIWTVLYSYLIFKKEK
ncbi:MAG: hypothetical protein ACD_81C00177G0002 [uncultured bacterium]|uniref:DUF1648 domain-containing protein n=2 Tax=Candidatus Wolfeibacteriota TaxID=1752735 RepID=A0A0G1H952_9BACT|nr:MAG: hypothetical protein ACD_81C00177G0002 [uncultured bacterium]KKR12979.1 MAG: hypothetical protein UT41_C0001G0523 [Candidatus Wolfebacteria bacterium GW2011_GWC2_39_22]KKT43906.1 MAG: hypothetical protein UW32_C0001G0498 [Candidatus Wolfebacteria bacterium GW2011_GWE2_44_13]HBI25368.1 hypothetical protein [Candidatus Wolfebacteria bacterium]